MKMNFLGKTGVRVSALCFGAMTFGEKGAFQEIGALSQKEADFLVGMALDKGINFFDTSDVYSEGRSETILGKALGSRRKEAILATKVRWRVGPGPNDVGLSRYHLIEACNASLKRMDTDYIDLYQLHGFDPITSLEETLRALDDLVHQGKVRYIGCSNFTAWQLMKALWISDKNGLEKFVAHQVYYSLGARELENELVPLCLDQGLGILSWSPLSGGFFSGKYRRGQAKPKEGRRADPTAVSNSFWPVDEEKGFDIVEELDRIVKTHKATVAQAALNYLLSKPGVTSVIIGATKPEHLTDNLKTTDWEMKPEEVERLDKLSRPTPLYPYWHQELTRSDR
jgi:aryl-alcohol dehydrogenase-like predicted oxidoreductase